MVDWVYRLLFVAACLGLPVVWGVAVHYLWGRWDRGRKKRPGGSVFTDYQI